MSVIVSDDKQDRATAKRLPRGELAKSSGIGGRKSRVAAALKAHFLLEFFDFVEVAAHKAEI